MSTVQITDKRGGVFEVAISFTYGECARLPFNSLRKVNARLDQVPHGGLKATAQFNLRNSSEAGDFVEMLDLFGEDGSYVHGSPADPDELKKDDAEEDDEEPGLWSAAAESTRNETAVPSPSSTLSLPESVEEESLATDNLLASSAEATDESSASLTESYSLEESGSPSARDPLAADDVDMEVEEQAPLPASVAESAWERAGDDAVALSIQESEDREETLARVAKAAGEEYTVDMVRCRLIECAYLKFKDVKYVVSFLQLRGWNDIDEDEIEDVLTQS